MLFEEGLFLNFELDEFAFDFIDGLGQALGFHLELGRRLVDQVDGFIGQKSVGNISLAEVDSRNNGAIGDVNAVMDLVSLFDTAQNRDGILRRRFVDENGLESSFERRIFFDDAILFERRRAHTTELATR